LDRTRRNTGEFTKSKGGKWGLKDWLPPNVQSLHMQAAKSKKRSPKKTKKNGKSADKTKTTKVSDTTQRTATHSANSQGGFQSQILNYIKIHPANDHTSETIASALKLRKVVTGMLLGKLIKSGQLQKSEAGTYRYSVVS